MSPTLGALAALATALAWALSSAERITVNHDSSPAPRGPLPPVVLFTAMAIMVAVHVVVPFVHLLASFWRVAVGALMLGVGVLLNLWADSLVTRAGTAVNPFEPSSALIEGGPFAFSRHPRYLGMVLILTGIALALGSLLPWLVIPVSCGDPATPAGNALGWDCEGSAGDKPDPPRGLVPHAPPLIWCGDSEKHNRTGSVVITVLVCSCSGRRSYVPR